MSAHWAHTASVSVSPTSAFWNGRHPRSFHQACGHNTQTWIQWTAKFAQKCSGRFAWEKSVTWTDRYYGLAGMSLLRIISNVTDEWCKRLQVGVHVKKKTFWVFSFTADYTHVYFNVLVCRTLQVSWFYCVKYTRISPFFSFTFHTVV